MPAIIMDGKKLSSKIIDDIKIQTENIFKEIEQKPGLAVILAGEDPASAVYVKNKEKRATEVGFKSEVIKLPKDVSKQELLDVIHKLNNDNSIHGILLQLPIPRHLECNYFLNEIMPQKDVDGFHPNNIGKLVEGQMPYAIPCTPKGIIKLIKEYNIEIEGKNAVVVGRSNIVGKPVAALLLNENATVTVAHSKTKNLSDITKNADILISATGIENMITADMVKEGSAVIDVGIVRTKEGKLKGDVDYDAVKNTAGYITPVPGGVGPMTIACLMENTLELFNKQQKR